MEFRNIGGTTAGSAISKGVKSATPIVARLVVIAVWRANRIGELGDAPPVPSPANDAFDPPRLECPRIHGFGRRRMRTKKVFRAIA